MDALPPSDHRPNREPNLPRAFATGYKPHSGDMMVYGGGAMTIVGVLVALINASPAFLIMSLVGSLSALYFWPVVDTRRPQLGADVNGIFVARYGILPWDQVADLHVEHHALRTIRLATLTIVPVGTIAEAIAQPDAVPLAERFAARNAKVRNGAIQVPLHTLALPIEEIEERLKALRAAAG